MSWATSRYQQSTVFLSERRFKLQDCLRRCCAGCATYSQRGSGIFARIGAAKAAWEAANESREVRVRLTQVAGGRDERWKDFCCSSSGREYERFSAAVQRCFGHGDYLRMRRCRL